MKPSAEKNKSKDIISPRLNEMWSRSYLGDTPRDNYNEPGIAEPEWWRGIKVEEILVVGSADEVLTDTIGEMAANLEVWFLVSLFLLAPTCFNCFQKRLDVQPQFQKPRLLELSLKRQLRLSTQIPKPF